MSSESFEVDYDAESVWFDGAWLGREDLARKIKSMIEAGDYRVARPSQALERLEGALAGARVLAVRVAPELADALEQAAARAGRPSSALLRDALGYYLGAAQQAAPVVAEPISYEQSGDDGNLMAEPVAPDDDAMGIVELTPKNREEPVVLE